MHPIFVYVAMPCVQMSKSGNGAIAETDIPQSETYILNKCQFLYSQLAFFPSSTEHGTENFPVCSLSIRNLGLIISHEERP